MFLFVIDFFWYLLIFTHSRFIIICFLNTFFNISEHISIWKKKISDTHICIQQYVHRSRMARVWGCHGCLRLSSAPSCWKDHRLQPVEPSVPSSPYRWRVQVGRASLKESPKAPCHKNYNKKKERIEVNTLFVIVSWLLEKFTLNTFPCKHNIRDTNMFEREKLEFQYIGVKF